MLNRFQKFGRESEKDAADFLSGMGYKIIERNHRNRFGEIDIIARDKDTIVFVEVKARSSSRFGPPKQAVDFRKQKKLSVIALAWLKSTGNIDRRARFDVIGVSRDSSGTKMEHIRNAFDFVPG